jgi:hypothetical protein
MKRVLIGLVIGLVWVGSWYLGAAAVAWIALNVWP